MMEISSECNTELFGRWKQRHWPNGGRKEKWISKKRMKQLMWWLRLGSRPLDLEENNEKSNMSL